MTLDEFIEMVERDRPETLTAADVARVQPNPWVNRAGYGKETRIRMFLAGHRYERQPGEAIWRRVDDADFDVLDDAAA
jgi:hypothetical protein